MKSFSILLLSLVMTPGLTPLGAEETHTQTDLQTSNKEVQAALQDVHRARQRYFNAVKSSGQQSAEAQTAKTELDTARNSWRTKMGDRQGLRREARREMRHRRVDAAKRSNTP